MKLSPEQINQVTLNKTDDELRDILFVHFQDYTAEVVEAARTEFGRRELETPSEASVAADIQKVRDREESPLSWPLRMLAFFVSTTFAFVPLFLANRHYVEKGEKRKAKEWVRWAIYGAIFYLITFFILTLLTRMGYK